MDTENRDVHNLLEELDLREGRIDYIFLNGAFTRDHVLASELFATRPLTGGMFCSDHFGVLTTIRF